MSSLTLKSVKKSYGDVGVLHGIDMQIAEGEFLVLVGPSGCGKSTLLRCIAGLETITEGQLSIGARVVNEVAPRDRDVAMVFQSYALYPHMTVRRNMAFALELRKTPQHEMEAAVANAAGMLGLDPLPPCHSLGSSHGRTRVFRHAYFEHPDYVPLLRRATATFEGWERDAAVSLLHRAGVLVLGPRGCPAVEGSRQAARLHGLETRNLGPEDLRSAHPQFSVGTDTEAVFEADAGFVRVERAIGCALQLAAAPR